MRNQVINNTDNLSRNFDLFISRYILAEYKNLSKILLINIDNDFQKGQELIKQELINLFIFLEDKFLETWWKYFEDDWNNKSKKVTLLINLWLIQKQSALTKDQKKQIVIDDLIKEDIKKWRHRIMVLILWNMYKFNYRKDIVKNIITATTWPNKYYLTPIWETIYSKYISCN